MLDPQQFANRANQASSMFDFSAPKQTEDKKLSKEEVRSLLSNVSDKKAALQKLVSDGYEIEGLQTSEAPQAPQAQKSSGIGQGIQNISAGIASGASQAVGGTLGIVGDFLSAPFSEDVSIGGIFTGENKGGIGQFFRDETVRQQAAGAQAFGADTESMGYKGGKIGTGLGLSIATPGGVMGLAGKGAGLGAKIGLGAAQGAIETGKFMGLTEGRLGTGGELATGAAFGGALPVAGAAIGKTRDFLTTKLPENLIATGIATPTKLLNASERLNKLGDESFKDATSASKWLLKNKITGDIEQRAAQLDALATKGRETAQNLLKGSKVVVADDIVSQAKAGLESLRPKLESAGLTKYTTMIDDFANKQTWTAEDLNKARTFMADKGGIFKHSGDWVDSLQKENLQDIWKAASQYLDETIPGFRAGNKDYEVASALSEAIKLKSAQDQARQVFSLVNVAGAGLGGIAGGLTGNDPLSVLQNAAIGAGLGLAGRAIFSPSNMSKLAVKLSEYAPKAEATKATKAIELFVKSRGENPIPQSVMNLIQKATKTLDPFKDLKFIAQAKKDPVKLGLSETAISIFKSAKSAKDALEKATKAGVVDEVRKAYFGSAKFGGKPKMK